MKITLGVKRMTVHMIKLTQIAQGLYQPPFVDKPHGIEEASILKALETVNRNDAPMLQVPGHLGFVEDAGSALRIVGLMFLNPLQCHVPIGFDVLDATERCIMCSQSTCWK